MKRINLNERVCVRLNAIGRAALLDYWRQSHPLNPERAADECCKGWRDEKLVEFHLWEVFNIFGPVTYMGPPVPFINNEIVLLRSGKPGG